MKGYRHVVTIDLTDYEGSEGTPEESVEAIKGIFTEELSNYEVEVASINVEYKETVTKSDDDDEDEEAFSDPDVEG